MSSLGFVAFVRQESLHRNRLSQILDAVFVNETAYRCDLYPVIREADSGGVNGSLFLSIYPCVYLSFFLSLSLCFSLSLAVGSSSLLPVDDSISRMVELTPRFALSSLFRTLRVVCRLF